MFPTKVLLATDGSAESAYAARMAVELSNKLGSELHVVHVGFIPSFHPASEPAILDPELQDMMRERAEAEAHEKLR